MTKRTVRTELSQQQVPSLCITQILNYHPALMPATSHAAVKNKLKVVGARAEICTLGKMHGKRSSRQT